jgi:hypothetical protein
MSNEFIRLRFVRTSGLDSLAIATREETCMPFVPSHVEAVIDGKYVGQHLIGGMLARDPGYDKSTLEHELFVDLPCDGDRAGAAASFEAYMMGSIGQPYDWEAIIGFALPGHWHLANHAICSAKCLLGVCADPVPWLRWPTAVPAHLVSPRDFLFMLSALVEIPH